MGAERSGNMKDLSRFPQWDELRRDMMARIVNRPTQPYIVITGCARSGTKYISEVLKKAGKDVGHWNTGGSDGIASDLVAPWELRGATILHQVRHPLHQIASMQTALRHTWNYIAAMLDFNGTDSVLRYCMRYWLKWNKLVAEKACLTYRVEDIDTSWDEIKQLLGLDGVKLPAVPKDTNSRKGHYKPVGWDELKAADTELAKAIFKQALEYGYTLEQLKVIGSQQEAGYYDKVFSSTTDPKYFVHYTRSPYFPVWSVIADRLTSYAGWPDIDVLEIGCGVGQLARLLHDRGLKRYTGLDFSSVAIRAARKQCPGSLFIQVDATSTDTVITGHDVMIMLEFLEHIEGDTELLKRIPAGTKVYASVPNFTYTSHIRYFADADSVKARYGALFMDFRVTPILLDEKGLTLFIIEGVRI